MDLDGRRVLVMGLGRHGGGVGAVRYLARRGALVTVTDLLSEDELLVSLGALDDLPDVELRLGGHREADFDRAELVVLNPAVLPKNRWLERVQARGTPTTTEIDLFLAACPADVIGVTGSNGKSTTVAMLSAALKAAGRQTWQGGNLGGSLLDVVDRMRPGDGIVLELSSFQLHRLATDAPPLHAAIVTNCTPNHLDWHADFASYAAAKRRIVELVSPDGFAVLNPDDAESWSWRPTCRGRILTPEATCELPQLAVPGTHNRTNARFVAAAADALGCPRATTEQALRQFAGLPHRIELVAEFAGRRFYDDSKSTTPEAAATAVNTLAEACPVWVLVGGADKGVDLDSCARAVARRARGAAVFGTVRDRLATQIAAHVPNGPLHVCERLEDALAWCWRSSKPGDAILLSPGCASLDQFRDYIERAAAFRACLERLARTKRPAARSR